MGRGRGKRREQGDCEPEHHPHQQAETGEQKVGPVEGSLKKLKIVKTQNLFLKLEFFYYFFLYVYLS